MHGARERETKACAFFFFNDTATTEIYTLSLHDALPIFKRIVKGRDGLWRVRNGMIAQRHRMNVGAINAPSTLKDRKSTRLNSRHANTSYAVFCLKQKKICGGGATLRHALYSPALQAARF